jgi:hypothetical protein
MGEANLIKHPTPPAGDPSIKFPGQRWDPATGDTRVFQEAGEVPEGWIDRYPTPEEMADAKVAVKNTAVADALPLTRAQITDYLKAGNVPYQGNASTRSLYDLLVASLKEALAALPTPVTAPEDADVPALLALFPAE